MVPFDDKSAFITSGIRVGVPAITTRGMKEAHMATVVEMIDKALLHAEKDDVLTAMKGDVSAFMKQFPLYPEL
jgi:glycine hydroxymethyltransferase